MARSEEGVNRTWTRAAYDPRIVRLGYRLVEMTPDERKAFNQTKGKAAGQAYIVEFSRRVIAEGR
ncbi:MAG TPA: hypothetical protein VE891_11715 [Allosphingosinicella sp.]|nr:hypothetical protein [Allosphingosinicella sp.]